MITTLLLAGVTVTLPLETTAYGTELTLAEVAEVAGDDAALVAELEGVALGYAPSPGYSRLLRVHSIRDAIRRSHPDLKDSELVFAGQQAVRVWPEVERIEPARVVELARAELESVAGTADVELVQNGRVQPLDVPLGDEPAELRVRPEERVLRSGATSIPVEVWVEGSLYRTIWTSWRLDVFETLPVLVRDVVAGEALAPRHFEDRRVKTNSAGRGKALSAELVVGAVAARHLKAGSTVSGADVHRPRIVQPRDAIHVEIRKGAVTARVAATARDAGAIGDRIRVVLDGSGRELGAVVLSRDLAVVQL